jgi:antitoxin VapB
MGTQLNIKSEDANRLASHLAELTGESLTTVVQKAPKAELERGQLARDIQDKVERMLAEGREIRAHLRVPITSDHSCLYDENGFLR